MHSVETRTLWKVRLSFKISWIPAWSDSPLAFSESFAHE
jgi:hypothetical protein